MEEKKIHVISGINLFSGGTLTIYRDFLKCLKDNGYLTKNKFVIFVHKKELFEDYKDDVEMIELPKSRKSYFYRLYYEYHYFKKYSKKHDVESWFSIHDFSPIVKAKKQFVYCHNPLPFYNSKTIGLFNYFYGRIYMHLYLKNIKSNDYVFVQQKWIGDIFSKKRKKLNVAVTRPVSDIVGEPHPIDINKNKIVFFFPSLPRWFKNFETACEAISLLKNENVELRITISGDENKYSKKIYEKYKNDKRIKFLGLQSKEEMKKQYNEADCLIFPSKCETWGLPISEFKTTGKPIIVSDLPYAHDTVGDYHSVAFFNPLNAKELSTLILDLLNGKNIFNSHKLDYHPDFYDWKSLVEKIY